MTAPHVYRILDALAQGDDNIAAWIAKHRVTRTQAYDSVKVLRKHAAIRSIASCRGKPATYALILDADVVRKALDGPQDNAPFAVAGGWSTAALEAAWPLQLERRA